MNTQPHLTHAILEELRKPFSLECIHFACQGHPDPAGYCPVTPYLAVRDVVERLDQVVGADWSREYEQRDGEVVCYLAICGAVCAGVFQMDREKGPMTSAYTTAFKLAALRFGIGRFVVELPRLWAKAKSADEGSVLEDGELERLRMVVDDFLHDRNPSGAPPLGLPRSEGCAVQPKERSGGRGAHRRTSAR